MPTEAGTHTDTRDISKGSFNLAERTIGHLEIHTAGIGYSGGWPVKEPSIYDSTM